LGFCGYDGVIKEAA